MALGYTVVPLCWIFDTPVSAVSDTVCLPKDWRRLKKEEPEPEQAYPSVGAAGSL